MTTTSPPSGAQPAAADEGRVALQAWELALLEANSSNASGAGTATAIAAPATANETFTLVRDLALAYLRAGKETTPGWIRRDRAGLLEKFPSSAHSGRLTRKKWVPRAVQLHGNILEVYSGKGVAPRKSYSLAPGDAVLLDGDNEQRPATAFTLVTSRGALHLNASSPQEKIAWCDSICRAIFDPERFVGGSAMGSVLLPPVLKYSVLARGQSGKSLIPRALGSFGSAGEFATIAPTTTVSSGEDGAMVARERTGDIILAGALKRVSKLGDADKTSTTNMSRLSALTGRSGTGTSYYTLRRVALSEWPSQTAKSSGHRPTSITFLDQSTRMVRGSPTKFTLTTTGGTVSLSFEAPDSASADAWFKAVSTALRAAANVVDAFARSFPKHVPSASHAHQHASSPLVTHPPLTDHSGLPPLGPSKASSTPPLPPRTLEETTATKKKKAREEEQEDDRPCLRVMIRRFDGEESKEDLVTIKSKLEDLYSTLRYTSADTETLTDLRASIHAQVPPDLVPLGFSILRVTDGVRSQLASPSSPSKDWGFSRVVQSLESETKLSSAIFTHPVYGEPAILVSAPRSLLSASATTGTISTEELQRSFENHLRVLEALLAESNRALQEARSELAALKSSSTNGVHNSASGNQLTHALVTLQRDGFIDESASVPALVQTYERTFDADDVSKLFTSTASVFRVAWRRMCGDPQRFRTYLEALESEVLIKYKIPKTRLSSPFWSNILKDSRFWGEDPHGALREWAKKEPWCEDDAERYSYLSSKMMASSAKKEEEFQLLRPKPTPPSSTASSSASSSVSGTSPRKETKAATTIPPHHHHHHHHHPMGKHPLSNLIVARGSSSGAASPLAVLAASNSSGALRLSSLSESEVLSDGLGAVKPLTPDSALRLRPVNALPARMPSEDSIRLRVRSNSQLGSIAESEDEEGGCFELAGTPPRSSLATPVLEAAATTARDPQLLQHEGSNGNAA